MISHKNILLSILGSAVLSLGLCQVHAISSVTEGGVLGLTLLLQNWWAISPAVTSLIFNSGCYLLGIRTLGREFLILSGISGVCYSIFYALFERLPVFWPQLAELPLAAAIVGALFVGVGVGLCVRAGGAPTGDDALAMSLNKLLGIPIEWAYLASDLTVLALSLSYIPVRQIGYSLLTVILSGQIVGLIQRHKR